MDSILKAFDLGRKNLDFKCPRKIRDRIAGEIIGEWYLIGRVLGLSHIRLNSILRQDHTVLPKPEDKAVAALDAWDEEYGRAATCLKLAEALYEHKKFSTLEILCGEVKQYDNYTKSARYIEDPTGLEHQRLTPPPHG